MSHFAIRDPFAPWQKVMRHHARVGWTGMTVGKSAASLPGRGRCDGASGPRRQLHGKGMGMLAMEPGQSGGIEPFPEQTGAIKLLLPTLCNLEKYRKMQRRTSELGRNWRQEA